MLDHVGRHEAAARIHNAWLRTIEDGVHTFDIHDDAVSQGAPAETDAFADAVIARLGTEPQTLPAVAVAESRTAATAKAAVAKPKPAKALVGVDVFLDWDQPGRHAAQLAQPLEAGRGAAGAQAQDDHQPRREGLPRRLPRDVLHRPLALPLRPGGRRARRAVDRGAVAAGTRRRGARRDQDREPLHVRRRARLFDGAGGVGRGEPGRSAVEPAELQAGVALAQHEAQAVHELVVAGDAHHAAGQGASAVVVGALVVEHDAPRPSCGGRRGGRTVCHGSTVDSPKTRPPSWILMPSRRSSKPLAAPPEGEGDEANAGEEAGEGREEADVARQVSAATHDEASSSRTGPDPQPASPAALPAGEDAGCLGGRGGVRDGLARVSAWWSSTPILADDWAAGVCAGGIGEFRGELSPSTSSGPHNLTSRCCGLASSPLDVESEPSNVSRKC